MTRSLQNTPLLAGFGPVCSPELHAVGIHSVARIEELGWQEAYLCWVARSPARINVNAAYEMIAAERWISWLDLSAADKARARSFVARLGKKSLGSLE